jgi:hypothetical protein
MKDYVIRKLGKEEADIFFDWAFGLSNKFVYSANLPEIFNDKHPEIETKFSSSGSMHSDLDEMINLWKLANK